MPSWDATHNQNFLDYHGTEDALVQNIALAAEALGLGGFPHYAAHRFGWTRAFGFRMVDRTFAQVLHKGFLGTLLMKLMGENVAQHETPQ